MTIKTEINGLPFEIELADGLNIEFSEGKIRVRKHLTLSEQWAIRPTLYTPPKVDFNNPYITWCAAATKF